MSSAAERTDASFFVTTVLAATAAATPYAQTNLGLVVPFAGTIVKAEYVPSAGIVANATNFQTLTVRNGGPGAAGTTTVASRAWSATNSTGGTKEQLALSGTPANLEVAAGDVLHYLSTVAGTGVALPAGTLIVHLRPRPY